MRCKNSLITKETCKETLYVINCLINQLDVVVWTQTYVGSTTVAILLTLKRCTCTSVAPNCKELQPMQFVDGENLPAYYHRTLRVVSCSE